jgi:hypothetical protein
MSSEEIECRGCVSFGVPVKNFLHCSAPAHYEDYECPCITCLVKMTCTQYHSCNLFDMYKDLFIYKWKE